MASARWLFWNLKSSAPSPRRATTPAPYLSDGFDEYDDERDRFDEDNDDDDAGYDRLTPTPHEWPTGHAVHWAPDVA